MKPNIIIVMSDQQRADLRASCGYPLDAMPFLDEWAKGGIDFDRAYTPNPTCMAARVSMFTGRYAECHKVRTNHNKEDVLYTKDLLDLLKEQGYRTALCGKNHSHRDGSDFDFSRLNGHLGNEDSECKTPEEFAFADFLTATKHMETHEPSPGGVSVQHPYRNVSDALTFIDEVNNERPFFAWISFAEPHNPYQVPEPYFDMFPPESLPKITTTTAGKGYKSEWLRTMWERVMGEGIEDRILRTRSNYLGMIRLIDDQFKRLIDGLETRGIADNTIVIYLSDHGDYAGEYGLVRKGADLPEVLTRIPMVWRGPGITPQGKSAEYCVNTVDILPTLCDMLGLELPFGCQGKSLLPILNGGEVPIEEFEIGYSENGFSGLHWTEEDGLDTTIEGATNQKFLRFDELNTWTQSGQVRMVRKGDYKVQVDMMGNGYLYHLKSDPLEVENLWGNEAYASVKADMLAALTTMMLRTYDTLPAPRRRYRVKVHPKGYWDKNHTCDDPGIVQEGR